MTTTDQARQEVQDLLVHIEELLAQTDDTATVNQVARRLAAVAECLKNDDEFSAWARPPDPAKRPRHPAI